MIDSRYRFGSDLRNIIISGSDKKTELRELFENNFFDRVGIRAAHSYFNQDTMNPYIFVHADIHAVRDKYLSSSEWECIDNIYYPKETMRNVVFACFNDAVSEMRLPKIKFPANKNVAAFSVASYIETATNLYFNINMKEIDEKARHAFQNIKFNLRFCMSLTSQHYYLIFDDLLSKETAIADGTVLKIIDFVFSVCKQNDPLQIFCNNIVTPIITSKEEIIESGKAMDIMRNNLAFDTL